MTAGTFPRAILGLAMSAAVIWTAYAIYDGLGQTARVERAVGIPIAAWLALLGLVAALQAWALFALWRRRVGSGRAVSWGFTLAVMFWLAYLGLGQPLDLYQLESALAVTAGVFALGLLQSERLAKLAERRVVPRIQIMLFNLCLTALLLEAALAALAWVSPRPVLMGRDGYVQSRLATYGFPKGFIHLGFACNQQGYYDQEFLPKAQRQHPTVLMIGDSFSASVVPHHHHFTTVCERALGDVDVYNMGLSGIGPEEYLFLLSHEGLQLAPDAVVINLFLGNDVANTRTGTGVSQFLKQWFDAGNVRIWFVPRRLLLISAERERARPGIFEKEPQRVTRTEAEILKAYPWVADHRLEEPSLSASRYLEIVGPQIESACPPVPQRLKPLLAHLATMKQLCHDIPFAVMLIPAEYQLEDALWSSATARLTGGPYQRQAAQAEIGRWLEAAGIPYLDLLPALQAAEPFEDGDRHCYFVRDTHFNGRGNRLAGESLAPFLRSLLR